MRIKRNVQRESVTEQGSKDDVGKLGVMSQLDGRSGVSMREARSRIYSCVFCEFVRENMVETDEDQNCGAMRDSIFEAKYLYHLKTYHSLER